MKKFLSILFFVPSILHTGQIPMCMAHHAQKKVQPEHIQCLATMIYGEARSESTLGQIAVAYTALNRAIGKNICNIVLAPKNYSVFNSNIALKAVALGLEIMPKHKNHIERKSWDVAVDVAHKVLSGSVQDPTNGATNYIAPKVMNTKKYVYPKWTRQYTVVKVIDNHVFYKK